jgi:hypothetical protein
LRSQDPAQQHDDKRSPAQRFKEVLADDVGRKTERGIRATRIQGAFSLQAMAEWYERLYVGG